MVDGFFWTRVTSKYLRFLYEDIAFEDLAAPMRERAQSVDAAPEAAALTARRRALGTRIAPPAAEAEFIRC